MTTLVHIYTSHVRDGLHLEVVRRFNSSPESGGPVPQGARNGEVMLDPDLRAHAITSHHVWDGCEIVVREVAGPAVKEPTNAALNVAGAQI